MSPFGPIFWFELMRVARRQHLIYWRCAYISILTVIAAGTYYFATDGWARGARPQDLAPITTMLFYGLFSLQFAVAIITPNWAAAAVAGEKERRTLPFLLATPLRDWEIVVGKFAAQVAPTGMLVLAGVPVLCALQFFGGVEPVAILWGYTVLAISVVSLASLAVLCSVYARTVRAAGQRTSQVVVGYLFMVFVLGKVLQIWPMVASFPGTLKSPAIVDLQSVVEFLNAGNPFAVAGRLVEAVRGGWRFADAVAPTVRHYLLFHAVLTAVFLTWAARRLRPIAAAQMDEPLRRRRAGKSAPYSRPPIGDRPVLWKAVHVDFRRRRTGFGQTIAVLAFALSFLPVGLALAAAVVYRNWTELAATMNYMFVRGFGLTVLCSLLVMIASFTSACIGRERRLRTLDDILLTNLSGEEILAQKWWASIVVVRWRWPGWGLTG